MKMKVTFGSLLTHESVMKISLLALFL